MSVVVCFGGVGFVGGCLVVVVVFVFPVFWFLCDCNVLYDWNDGVRSVFFFWRGLGLAACVHGSEFAAID